MLAILILLIYSNTFHAAFQFDDKPNIINNERLQITNLKPSSLWQTFFSKGGKDAYYRPIPSLSLALNWYFSPGDPFGFHLVNIAIHIITAFFLFLAIGAILQTPNIKQHYNREDVYFISVIGSVLWAINPIQTQAVTYIVQRMASMAAMFFICSIFFYVKGRLAESGKARVWFFMACLLSFVCALMSKENAAMLPFSLILIETLFFHEVDDLYQQVKGRLPVLTIAGVLIVLLGIILFTGGTLDYFLRAYASRPFTLFERLLTQPRVVLYYISQIFYPLPSRLSITHDVIVSTSLFSPWTTLPSITIVMLLVGIGISQMKRRPLVSIAILFFFLNHVIESTLLPLELIFEHRNYLPSLFLFLPIAGGLRSFLNFYRSKSRFMFMVMVSFVTLVLIGIGCFTYIRNHAWKTQTTLWHDAMLKAPKDARPAVNLAIQLAWSANPTPLQLDLALAMLKKAMALNTAHNFLITDIINNIGLIYYKQGQYQKAVNTYKRGLSIDPSFLKMRYDLISSLVMLGKFAEGNIEADKLIENPKNYLKSDYFKLKGFILLWQDNTREALIFFEKALEMEPDNKAVLLNTGVALGMLGENQKAESFLNMAARMAKDDIRPYFALIENSVRAGDMPNAERHAEKMFADFTVQSIINGFYFYTENYRTAPMGSNFILPILKKTMRRMVDDLEVSVTTVYVEDVTPVQ